MKSDTVTSIAATIIALCALVVSVMQGCHQTRHNRLMVTPHLNVNATGVYANLPEDLASYRFSYEIGNDGLGPARITKITYTDTLTGRDYDDPRLLVRQKEIDFKVLFFWGYTDLVILKEGASIPLFRLSNEYLKELSIDGQRKRVESIQKAFQTTKITVHYESLLGDAYQATWKPG